MRAETAIYFRKGRLLAMAMLALFLCVVFGAIVAMAFEDIARRPLVFVLAALFSILELLFIAILLWAVTQLFRRSPALVFGEDGLTVNSSILAPGFIPWSNIQGAYSHTYRSSTRVAVALKDPNAVLRGHSMLKTLGLKINLWTSKTPVWIATFPLPIGADELRAMIRERSAGGRV